VQPTIPPELHFESMFAIVPAAGLYWWLCIAFVTVAKTVVSWPLSGGIGAQAPKISVPYSDASVTPMLARNEKRDEKRF
jgi:hypothetical protein